MFFLVWGFFGFGYGLFFVSGFSCIGVFCFKFGLAVFCGI